MRQVSTEELCVYLRLLRESLALNENFIARDWPSFDQQSRFWARYADMAGYCDVANTSSIGGLSLLIDQLEKPEKYGGPDAQL